MLELLHIENIAVIERSEIRFHAGFNVLTGETGAGKSIVIDAISAILGERTSREIIRTGAPKAFVSAIFSGVPACGWFAENQVDYSPEELSIQREIFPDGRNVCRVNGRPVTVGTLRKLGLLLIAIHGQHDSQQLFDEEKHLEYLDLYAKDQPLLEAYRAQYAQVQEIRKQISALSMDEAQKLRLHETLEFQIAEIEKAALQPGEEEALLARRKVLQSAEKLTQALEQAVQCLYGDETSDGAAGLISEAERALSRVSGVSARTAELHQRLSELMYAAQDAAEELRDEKDGLSYSEGELEQIEERLDVLHRLKRKYGASVEEVLAFLDGARQRLDEITFAADHVERLQKKLGALQKELDARGLALREARQAAAERMRERIQQELAQLDMPKIQFQCEFTAQPPQENGVDFVRFLMSANVGESLRPMAKVASGGELARITLALKNVLAEQDRLGTMIFDEVDAGVSGRAAQKVAVKLWTLARGRQVLCVTHLPQLAAMADTHFTVEKRVAHGRTFTSVLELDEAGRRRELARLTGGEVVTETTLAGAQELLNAAAQIKA
mgnify:CR=1 FL=1